MISKGLVIDDPWISLILDGQKTWEMRSRDAKVRGTIALIRKGSGMIVGTANLVGSTGPFDRDQMLKYQEKHRIPSDRIKSGSVDTWCYAWQLEDVKRLAKPVPYTHPKGAVIWVKLDTGCAARVTDSLSERSGPAASPAIDMPADADAYVATAGDPAPRPPKASDQESSRPATESVPVSKDGSCFDRDLGVRGYFQVGAKDDEVRFDTYEEALEALRRMKTARWRRPNQSGNWGIVAATRWQKQS